MQGDPADTGFAASAIRSHPRYPELRAAHVEGFVRLFTADLAMMRLMIESGRLMTCSVLLGLHAGRQSGDRTTWPTLSAIQSLVAKGGWASPRQTTEILARMRILGQLRSDDAPHDRRVKILVPMDVLVAGDRRFLAALIGPLELLRGDGRYAPIIEGDPAFHMAYRRTWLAGLAQVAGRMNGNAEMGFLWSRHAGYVAFMLVVQEHLANGFCGLRFSSIADRLGVSRTHIRAIFSDGAALGLFRLSGKSGGGIALTPAMLAAFDRLVCEMGAGYDAIMSAVLREQGIGDDHGAVSEVPLADRQDVGPVGVAAVGDP